MCPEYEEKRAFSCQLCHEGIFEGDAYYEIGQSRYHEGCLYEGYTKRELLLLLGYGARTVGKEN